MAEIKCPKCGEIIKLDKSEYDSLLSDIKETEIEKRVNEKLELQKKAIEALNQSDNLKQRTEFEKKITVLNNQINVLNEKLNNADDQKRLAVSDAVNQIKEQLNKKNQEVTALVSQIDSIKKDAALNEKTLKEKFGFQLDAKDEEIQRWKQYRVGSSTKDIGENFEKYCHDAFESIRSIAYPRAYFEKDNEVVGGGKGDFIFKDFDVDGIELISIMFEMKNENDESDNKHKNEDFFKKLDEDRRKKGCEYAILVTTLEPESDLYNKGIVDVSHKYPKMFVIRPQFFLSIIGLLRNMALKTYEYKKQVVVYQNEHMDITNFEATVKAIAEKISKDYQAADDKYNEVEKMCDDIIKKVNAFREAFRIARNHIGTAQNRLDDLSVRKLTKNNPTMKQRFDNLKNNE